MALVVALQKAIDYMEKHMLEPVTIEDIARHANMSPFHFQRTFMILTDLSVGDYLRRRRLTLAAQELCETGTKVIDLAYKYGYDTPESFAKAFRKQHGVTPSEARKGLGGLQAYNRLTIQVNLKGAEPMRYRIAEREAFQVVGVKREFDCGGEEMVVPGIPSFWGEAHQSGTVRRMEGSMNGQIKGMLGITDNYNAARNTMDYWIAAECAGDVPEGLAAMEIPASKWVAFEVKGPIPDAMIRTWKRIYSEWFPSSGYEPAEAASLEVYLDSDLYGPDAMNEIWVAIK
ncbi:AraC family transcriptional regulator [Paenibacillus arenilitoris]|uniref:AraC family transcriptional regulator n=1 Tax=Paenibacillus arenilitoris TaxID=2772299 RepID=A0A927CIV8_9BACL|nr:AraC family transcriptional regulator [Paenibacillus arenilitoris]MBD2868290.1 AraC family transcriptional regulator [Paenibacillus arenilitoris]